MFSATFPNDIQKLAQQFMRDYIWVGVGRVGGAVDTVKQDFIVATNNTKEQKLMQLLRQNPNDSTLIFVAMKRTASALNDALYNMGIGACPIHGDLEQPEREFSLSQFRSGKVKILVATDVAARGLDIPKVTHVINYDLPEKLDDYVHRIGRTGRVGREGYATSFFNTHGNYSNFKILGGLLGVLKDAKQPIPPALQRIADEQGIKPQCKGKGKDQSFGGNDARGGASWSHKVTKGGGGGGAGGKGKGKGAAGKGAAGGGVKGWGKGKGGKAW